MFVCVRVETSRIFVQSVSNLRRHAHCVSGKTIDFRSQHEKTNSYFGGFWRRGRRAELTDSLTNRDYLKNRQLYLLLIRRTMGLDVSRACILPPLAAHTQTWLASRCSAVVQEWLALHHEIVTRRQRAYIHNIQKARPQKRAFKFQWGTRSFQGAFRNHFPYVKKKKKKKKKEHYQCTAEYPGYSAKIVIVPSILTHTFTVGSGTWSYSISIGWLDSVNLLVCSVVSHVALGFALSF